MLRVAEKEALGMGVVFLDLFPYLQHTSLDLPTDLSHHDPGGSKASSAGHR